MNKVICVVFVAGVIAIATSAPTSPEPTTTIKPLGSMNMDELIDLHIQHKFHRYDESLPSVVSLFRTYIGKMEDIIADPETRRSQVKYYVQIKEYLSDFMKDIENEEYLKECGLKQMGLHYHHLFKELSKNAENQNIKDLYESFNNDYNTAFDKESETLDAAIRDLNKNDALATEVRKNAKFDTICCKFWDKSYHHNMFKGTC